MNMTEEKVKENNSNKNNNDYSGNNYNNVVDKRILKVCENAENEYSQSRRSKHSNNNDCNNIENGVISKNNQNINNNNINAQKEINLNNNNQLSKEVKGEMGYIPINREVKEDPKNAFLTQSFSKIARINNKSIDTDANILSKIKFGLQNNNFNNNNNINNNINSPFHKGSDNFNKKLALYNLNKKDKNKNRENKNKDKENKKKTDLSKILLEARDLIKKLEIKQAYILLRKTISTGIQHSDLFYLYGEVNRLVKQNKVAEEYLLKALKFELHSPYVFYSLGILYQDLKQYQNSNKFFKLFSRLLNNADLHFQMGINYFYMKDYVSAAEELSNAIELNNECPEYYQFRSEIYKNMGLKEMENEDYNMYQYIIRKKREDNQ